MKLESLFPHWTNSNRFRIGTGLSFRCPHCQEIIYINFSNPLDGGNPEYGLTYIREGATFDTLTILNINIANHWIGNIIDGKIWSK